MKGTCLAVRIAQQHRNMVLGGHDTTDGRAHGKRLRRELVCIAARATCHAGRIEVHAAPEDHEGCFADAWRALDALLARAGP